ncbi:hypothetical protein X975_16736, partial [Stegodyphus mimosarum]
MIFCNWQRCLTEQSFEVGGGSKLGNETGISNLRAVVETGSCSVQKYLLHVVEQKMD